MVNIVSTAVLLVIVAATTATVAVSEIEWKKRYPRR